MSLEPNNRNTLTILVGNIGSGKTTWIKKNRKSDEYVISRDDLRYMLGAGEYIFNPLETEPLVKFMAKQMVEEACSFGLNIIIDEVNVHTTLREKYINIAKDYDYKVRAVVFPNYGMKTHVDRRMANPHGQPIRSVWEKAWVNFNEMYEEPSLDEGIDEIIML